jgi:hypothetical protein
MKVRRYRAAMLLCSTNDRVKAMPRRLDNGKGRCLSHLLEILVDQQHIIKAGFLD